MTVVDGVSKDQCPVERFLGKGRRGPDQFGKQKIEVTVRVKGKNKRKVHQPRTTETWEKHREQSVVTDRKDWRKNGPSVTRNKCSTLGRILWTTPKVTFYNSFRSVELTSYREGPIIWGRDFFRVLSTLHLLCGGRHLTKTTITTSVRVIGLLLRKKFTTTLSTLYGLTLSRISSHVCGLFLLSGVNVNRPHVSRDITKTKGRFEKVVIYFFFFQTEFYKSPK